ncbi:MAG: UDP-N-acetylglucosamine 2-epimerase (non-hydrolyzing) [Deltaproteobacteria bacterium]|nr:UDP-N-acetylglucosamine 2-epimerase (non-hydrolyzing) [Deltaproteobacteria bacterium]
MKKKISFIFGTRPEAIKLCPLITAMQAHPAMKPHVCVTGQHREMLDQVLVVFEVVPDVDLSLMQQRQTLGGLTSRAIASIDAYLAEHKPDMVIVQGDTTTAFCAALSAFYHKIPVAHVEAGLRTWNRYSPFPEEMNRVLVTRLAELHFVPTMMSRDNLLKDGILSDRIFVTGNTVIDALLTAVEKVKCNSPDIPSLPSFLMNSALDNPLVLITGHRRENFGKGFENICHAIAELARRFPETHFVYPVHLNPSVREPVYRILNQSAIGAALLAVKNIHLIEPLSYLPFIRIMDRAMLILTDSGGVQEEAPSLGKPVLVMRDTTERPEAVAMGTAKLVGTDVESIVENVSVLLTDRVAYEAMANAVNPYGDGRACGRIIGVCAQILSGVKVRPTEQGKF